MPPTLKVDSAAIQQYYRMLKEAEGQDALHEGIARDIRLWQTANAV